MFSYSCPTAFCARGSESFPEVFLSPASIDSMAPGLVSFR
jgi:hypothetical protein